MIENFKTKKLNNVKINSLDSIILEEEKKISDQVPLLSSGGTNEDINKISVIKERNQAEKDKGYTYKKIRKFN